MMNTGVEFQNIPVHRSVWNKRHLNTAAMILVGYCSHICLPLDHIAKFKQKLADRQKDLKVLTVGFPCQLLHHFWLKLAVWFTHDLQLSSSPPNPPWHAAPVTTVLSSPLLCQKTYAQQRRASLDTSEIKETHVCFVWKKKLPFKSNESSVQCGSLWQGSWSAQSSALALHTDKSKPRGPVTKGQQVVESIRDPLSACVSASFLHSTPWAKSGVWMRCYLRPWIQESLSGWVKHAHSLTVILCSSHPSFPSAISIALGKLL